MELALKGPERRERGCPLLQNVPLWVHFVQISKGTALQYLLYGCSITFKSSSSPPPPLVPFTSGHSFPFPAPFVPLNVSVSTFRGFSCLRAIPRWKRQLLGCIPWRAQALRGPVRGACREFSILKVIGRALSSLSSCGHDTRWFASPS